MGPNETASTLPGGPRVISVFDVHGCCRAQIKHFFVMLIGSRTAYRSGLKLVNRLHRMRMRFWHSIALKALDQKHWQIMPQLSGLLRELVDMIQAVAYTV